LGDAISRRGFRVARSFHSACRLAAVLVPMSAFAQTYTALRITDHEVPIVRLTDAAHGVEVSVAPGIGNRAYEMKVHGKNILYFPFADVSEFQKHPRLCGIPFLAPWADLLSEPGFWANGKRYAFNMDLGNVRGNMPIHGLLVTSPLWRVTEVSADGRSAHVTSRLELWRYPDLLAQWPFAHEYEMTYSLADGALEVKTTIANRSAEPMPVAIGYHSFFQIPDIARDEWVAHFPARIHVIPGEHNIPTGEMRPLDLPNPLPLRGRTLDDGFTDFERDSDSRAHFWIEAGGRRVETLLGPKYNVATIWLPNGPGGQPREFICFEPLSAIINGINLAHEGKWNGLQMLPPEAKWSESFWVRASGL
jgi:aldose 1-epimerase